VRGRTRRRAAPGRGVAVDALLYAASATFAVHLLGSSPWVKYRTWAGFAWPAYTAGAAAALVLAVLAARLGRRRLAAARLLLALLVLAGALVLPLTAEVRWRPVQGPVYAPSEVVLTESAAADLLRGRDPYSARFTSPELAGRERSVAEYFPYLPGMAVFGLPRALLAKTPWTDARVFFALATLLAATAALYRQAADRRLRALQLLVVLPTGASVLVTGGDDVPVLALSLCAVVLFSRGRDVASAFAIGAAAMLKLTAWPLLLALAVAARGDPSCRGRGASALTLAAAVVGLAVLAAAAAGPAHFADDVLLFPLGLTPFHSPAGSTSLGSALLGTVSGAPGPAPARIAATAALLTLPLLVGVASLAAVARARGPRPARAAGAAAAAGAMLAALVVVAPVSRAGYVIYPLELLLWAGLLHERRRPEPEPLPTAERFAW
jgi:hypothetical protein